MKCPALPIPYPQLHAMWPVRTATLSAIKAGRARLPPNKTEWAAYYDYIIDYLSDVGNAPRGVKIDDEERVMIEARFIRTENTP